MVEQHCIQYLSQVLRREDTVLPARTTMISPNRSSSILMYEGSRRCDVSFSFCSAVEENVRDPAFLQTLQKKLLILPSFGPLLKCGCGPLCPCNNSPNVGRSHAVNSPSHDTHHAVQYTRNNWTMHATINHTTLVLYVLTVTHTLWKKKEEIHTDLGYRTVLQLEPILQMQR